jgi:hypothetical protein
MGAQVREISRWALVPLAPVLFVVIFMMTLWREGGEVTRDALANTAMVVVLFALGLTSVAAIAGL